MLSPYRLLAPVALVCATLAGCSFSLMEHKIDYRSAVTNRAPSLEVPPDLTTPNYDDRYALKEGPTTFSAYDRERAVIVGQAYEAERVARREPLPGEVVQPWVHGAQIEVGELGEAVGHRARSSPPSRGLTSSRPAAGGRRRARDAAARHRPMQ